jgi:crotonobetainyl-CoA:carnitine CoA-transferase CaiB-like acyl-CoA transferase
MEVLVTEIDEILAGKSRDEWGEIFDSVGLIWGPVLTLDEVARDPQADAIGMFPEIEHPQRGTYRSVRAPMRFEAADVRPRGPAPEVGQHTSEVLRAAGLSEAEIAALVEQGAIGTA